MAGARLQRDYISELPQELALIVLKYLLPKNLLSVAQTCWYWRLVNERFIRGGRHHNINSIHLSGDRILSSSDNSILKVWSANTGQCVCSLVAPDRTVHLSYMVDDLVVCASQDRSVCVWDVNTGALLRRFVRHRLLVQCIGLHDDTVATSSRDSFWLWNARNKSCRQLFGHNGLVRCVSFHYKTLVTSADDRLLKVWDLYSGKCLRTIDDRFGKVILMEFDGVHIVAGYGDSTVRVWQASSCRLLLTFTDHRRPTWRYYLTHLCLHGNIVATADSAGTIEVWNVANGENVHTLSVAGRRKLGLTGLYIGSRFIVASCDGGRVHLWDSRTGRFVRKIIEKGSGNVYQLQATDTKIVCLVQRYFGPQLLLLNFDIY